MKAQTQTLSFDGALLQRGFWLYVWEITNPNARKLHYVGRTGDSSSRNAQSPFNRMSQHLGFNKKSNVLRCRLKELGIEPTSCTFQLFAYGPVLAESSNREGHRANRDQIAAMEKALADRMAAVGYNVLNSVSCRMRLDEAAFGVVFSAFAEHFPQLKSHGHIALAGGSRARA